MDSAALSAVKSYAASRPATQAGTESGGSMFGRVAMNFAQTMAQGEAVAQQAMVGDADPHALVQALAQTELAVETAVTVRNKVVEAYQEILRMPV
ncbi:flagellar hook-basal body complex protein FliE [uncultured Tateyamaria sp.]|uniref:flagellar hook-basal body complex protein FliE n=1 Tax=uncultured Tateyamaria sp. TaxID=455651 RepID=UPI002601F604|nr:flagellar hook-basal body complex protein FliE [uncultured Tateyamaria sp.]